MKYVRQHRNYLIGKEGDEGKGKGKSKGKGNGVDDEAIYCGNYEFCLFLTLFSLPLYDIKGLFLLLKSYVGTCFCL